MSRTYNKILLYILLHVIPVRIIVLVDLIQMTSSDL